MDFITEERCNSELRDLKKKKKLLKDTVEAEKENILVDVKITIWKRIMYHLKKGRIMTIDELDRIKLWDDVKSA